MSTPPAQKTTFSSRMKMAATIQANGQTGTKHRLNLNNNLIEGRANSGLQPPGQFIKNRATATPHISSKDSTVTATRLARLVNGIPTTMKDSRQHATSKHPNTSSTTSIASSTDAQSRPMSIVNHNDQGRIEHKNGPVQSLVSKLAPKTDVKSERPFSRPEGLTKTSSRILAPSSRLSNTAALNSRSSSILSNMSTSNHLTRQPLRSSTLNENKPPGQPTANIPSTNVIRKGLAKFANPIECQRQFQALNTKIKDLENVNRSKATEIAELQDRLENAINVGSGYATTVQYLAVKLKLADETDLETECEDLKKLVQGLKKEKDQFDDKVEEIVRDYKNHIQIEHDLKQIIQQELDDTRKAHFNELNNLNSAHVIQLNDLINKHAAIEEELKTRIGLLETELGAKSKELSDLRKEHEQLTSDFNKLEESLTKDKDARIKYAQEKISQLQKDVESINSVLEMRQERIHELEKDKIILADVQSELAQREDTIKSLRQQIESLQAALEKRKEHYDTLIANHEKISQELKKERRERRRMTMRTEQLEYVLNDSCASESNKTFDASVRDLDGSDHMV